MARYSEEFKESVIQKMMPPNNVPVSQLVRETGISDATLYTWRKKAISQGVPVRAISFGTNFLYLANLITKPANNCSR